MKAKIIEPKKIGEKSEKKLRVAAYARVSTDNEEQEGSFENQKKYYEDKIKNNPNYEFVRVFADQAISGTTDKRPEFQQMIRFAEEGAIDLIITKSISRFSRNVADLHKYTEKLKSLGVNVKFEEEGIEIEGAQGTLLLSILGAIAQMEVENTSQHINWALGNKMSNSELVGQPNPLGYDVIKDVDENGNKRLQLVINDEEAEIVRYIYKRYIEGIGAHTIAKELESMGAKTKKGSTKWHDSTVMGILKNEKYIGKLIQGKTYTVSPINHIRKKNNLDRPKYETEDNHDAIISKDDFDKAQEIIASRRTSYENGRNIGTTQNSAQSDFTSKIRCAYCGKNYVRRIVHKGTKSEKAIWQCATYSKRGKSNCPYCKTVDEETVKQAFVHYMAKLLEKTEYPIFLSEKSFEDHVKESQKINSGVELQIEDVEKKIRAIDKKTDHLLDIRLDEKISEKEFDIKLKGLREEKASEEKILERIIKEHDLNNKKIRTSKEIRKLIDNGSAKAFDVRLFNLIVDHITVGGFIRDDEGKLISDPKKIHFEPKAENLDRHSFNYYNEKYKGEDLNLKSEYQNQALMDAVYGISEEEKQKALEEQLEKEKNKKKEMCILNSDNTR